jgi:hypothetical protein
VSLLFDAAGYRGVLATPNLANGETGRPGGREVCSDVVGKAHNYGRRVAVRKKSATSACHSQTGSNPDGLTISMQRLA